MEREVNTSESHKAGISTGLLCLDAAIADLAVQGCSLCDLQISPCLSSHIQQNNAQVKVPESPNSGVFEDMAWSLVLMGCAATKIVQGRQYSRLQAYRWRIRDEDVYI